MSRVQVQHRLPDADILVCMIKNVHETKRIQFIQHFNLHKERINDENETLLHHVAKSYQIEITKLLIRAGAEVNATTKSQKTPMMLAIENEPFECLEVVEILYKANADISITDRCGKSVVQIVLIDFAHRYDRLQKFFLNVVHRECMYNSEATAKKLTEFQYPLWRAVLLGNTEVIEHMVVVHQAAVDGYQSGQKITAIAKAVELMDFEMVKVLIKCNANVDISDNQSFLPISWYGSYIPGSIQCPEIIDILLRHSILLKDLHQENIVYQFKSAFERGNKEVIQILLEYHNNFLNLRDMEDMTPLHYLSGNYHADITEALRGQVIDVNIRDMMGCTPLHMATKYSHSHVNTFQYLLENGSDVNATTLYEVDYKVPLFYLSENYSIPKEVYLKIIKMFLQHNLNVQFIGLNEKTVFDIIIERQSFYMAEPLLAHLAVLDELQKPIIKRIRDQINSYKILQKYFHLCKVELVKMKSQIINGKFTLYMILVNHANDQEILKSCRFNLNSLSKLDEFKEQFYPIEFYNDIIKKRISRIVSKLELWHESASILCTLMESKIDPSGIPIAKIVDYLDADDDQHLHNLIKVL